MESFKGDGAQLTNFIFTAIGGLAAIWFFLEKGVVWIPILIVIGVVTVWFCKKWLCVTIFTSLTIILVSLVLIIDYTNNNGNGDEILSLIHKFDNQSLALQVEIQPTPPLIVGQEIYLHFTNNSNSNGYFLAFSIDSEGKLFSFVPKSLKLPEIQRYLKIDKGQTIIIPQPNVPEDPFIGITAKTVGSHLVVILIDELPSELVGILLLESEISTSKVLTNLHEKLSKPVLNEVGGTRRLKWSSLVIDYETVSSKTKED